MGGWVGGWVRVSWCESVREYERVRGCERRGRGE